jgi:predicted HicB family RNase H-like nuclease
MSNFALRLPDSLFERARILAERDNCSLNQLFAVAIAERGLEAQRQNATRRR